MEVRVGPAVLTIHIDDEVLVCEPNGNLSSDEQQGYFIADTRIVSGYRLKIGRLAPVLLNSSQVAANSARFEFTNPLIVDNGGTEIPASSLHLRLDRVLGRGVHEDYQLTNYSGRSLELVVEVSIESDFADLFDVKSRRLQRRGRVESFWDTRSSTLVNSFTNGRFARSIRFEARADGETPNCANGGLLFPVKLAPGATWHSCLLWRPVLDDEMLSTIETCHDLLGESSTRSATEQLVSQATSFVTSDPKVTATIRQAVDDLVGLRMRARVAPGFLEADQADPGACWPEDESDLWVPAAGVPWFVSIFGRDALITSLQSLSASYRFAKGSLRSLAALQAKDIDDDRDMQPGKIEHELRRGELAELRLIPHTPYYGSHDATPLFVLTAAESWRWNGDRDELDRLRPHVERALSWIDLDGDLDGDGLQEYQTRSTRGYFNQGWKDAGDAILHADGSLPELPIATCDLQGLVVAAKRAWAEVLESTYGERRAAGQLRDEATRLAGALEERFYWEDEGTYYLGLDGAKRPIETVASNAGHLLFYGAIDDRRAEQVASRLFADDMWSGWGIRTISALHPSYNPFSYQLGSVWPHDNVLVATGLRRYGLDEKALTIARTMFDAADCLVNRRLPELFSGLERDRASFPVQYPEANVPQAWASGAIIQLVEVMLGIDPDVVAGELRLRPALPPWLSEISLSNLLVGDSRIDFSVRRDLDGAVELNVVNIDGSMVVGLTPR